MNQLSEISGMEFDWFAADRVGNIALFATAGEGFVPEAVISAIAEHAAIADSIAQPNWGSERVWDDCASNGVYVFDWSLQHRRYELKRVPNGALNSAFSKAKAITAMPKLNIAFHGRNTISVSELSSAA